MLLNLHPGLRHITEMEKNLDVGLDWIFSQLEGRS